MNKNMTPKLPNLPCFKAFGAISCPDVCSFLACMWGVGVTSVFLNYGGESAFAIQDWESQECFSGPCPVLDTVVAEMIAELPLGAKPIHK